MQQSPRDSGGTEVRLSVLDTVMLGAGKTAQQAVGETIQLAQRAEELGLARYWMAEHHGVKGVISSAPIVTIGAVAAATRRIHVGSGGIMLPNHVPLVIAEQFGTLASLYPDRIDLGVGRAAPEPRTAAVLRRSLSRFGADELQQQIRDIQGFLSGDFPSGHPYSDLFVSPRAEQPPSVWVLGSSFSSAQLAATLGVPYAYAHHFGGHGAADAFTIYRDNFQPSATLDTPYTIVTANVIVAPTQEEAEAIGKPAALMFLRLTRGQAGLMPSPEQVEAHHWTAEDLAFLHHRHDGQAIGTPAYVRGALTDLLARTDADELMMTTQMYSLADRTRTLETVNHIFTPQMATTPPRRV